MDFKKSLSVGGIGEHVFWNFAQNLDSVRSVVDVRQDKLFQQVDVDFLVETTKRQFQWWEVKTDFTAHRTGNIAYEVSTSGNIGCFEKTKAQFIAYYLVESKTLYVLNVAKLKDYAHHPMIKHKEIPMGDNAKGYLLDIIELHRYGVIVGEYKEVE